MANATNPITACYAAIVAALKANATFAALVQLGNIKDFSDGALQNLLTSVQAGNLPEVTLVENGVGEEHYNSRDIEWPVAYTLAAVTDTMQVSTINDLILAATCATFNLENTARMDDGSGNQISYIRSFRRTSGNLGSKGLVVPTVNGDAQRGVNRWGALIGFEATVYLPRNLMWT